MKRGSALGDWQAVVPKDAVPSLGQRARGRAGMGDSQGPGPGGLRLPDAWPRQGYLSLPPCLGSPQPFHRLNLYPPPTSSIITFVTKLLASALLPPSFAGGLPRSTPEVRVG